MANWWENSNNSGGVSGTWWGNGSTCRDGCVPGASNCTFGCTDPLAINYDPLAQCDDGSCDIITYECTVFGCTDATACNYDPLANTDDSSCEWTSCVPCYVPDDNFEQKLIDLGFDDVLDDYVLTSNINTVTTLVLPSHLNISNLTGIECFTALVQLTVRGNDLTSIDVSNNTALMLLDVSQQVDTYSSGGLTILDVSNNDSLWSLECGANQLTNLDVSNNTDLNSLWCDYNQLTTLDVSANTALTGLRCDNNLLTSLDMRNANNINMSYVYAPTQGTPPYNTTIYVDNIANANAKVANGSWDFGNSANYTFSL